MFGYVKPYVPELKVAWHRYYKAAYCGLCSAMKKETGHLSTLTLSYDITFLVLMRLAVLGEVPEFYKKRCIAHPLKKRLAMKTNDALIFSAHAAALLSWHKIADDISDEKGLKKLSAYAMKLLFRSSYLRAEKGYEKLDEEIKEELKKLSELEKKNLPSADEPARIFGSLMSKILTFSVDDAAKRLILSAVGDSIGRWIYLADAVCDVEEDRKKGSYNPFLLLYGGAELDREKKLDIEGALMGFLKKAKDAFDLVDMYGRSDLEGLIYNIICEGLPHMGKTLLFGDDCEQDISLLKNEIGDLK